MVPVDPPPVIAPPPPYTCPRCWGTGHEGGDDTREDCVLCAGRGHTEDQRLSGHFALSELVRARGGYDQSPPVDVLERLGELARHLLEPVRQRFGRPLRVNSGYRCRSLDAAVAGPEWGTSQLSAHATGAAADVCPVLAPGEELQPLLVRIVEIVRTTPGLAWDQVILEGGCVHLAIYSPYGTRVQRREVRVRCPTTQGSYTYPLYLPGDADQLRRCG